MLDSIVKGSGFSKSRTSNKQISILLILLSVFISICYAEIMLFYTRGKWILPLDDSYIYLQYAQNLAHGYFFRFNITDPVSTGTTSPLYAVLLSVGSLVGFDGDKLVVFTFVLNTLLLGISTVVLFLILGRTYSRTVALLSTILVILSGTLCWGFLIGMEIGMVVLLFLLFTYSWLLETARQSLKFSPFLLALVAISRPEAALYAFLFSALAMLIYRRREGKLHRLWLLFLPVAALFAVLAFNYLLTGHFGPNSARPKSPFYTPYFSILFVLQHATNFLIYVTKSLLLGAATPNVLQSLNAIDSSSLVPPGSLIFFLLAGVPGFIREIRNRTLGTHALFSTWFLSGVAAVAMLSGSGAHHFRYILPFLLPFIALIVPGILIFVRSIARRNRGKFRRLAFSFLGYAMVFQFFTAVNFLLIYGQGSVSFLDYRNVADFIRKSLPADARIATLDVGILGFYSERPIFDLYGLVTNEMSPSTFFYADTIGGKYEYMKKMPESKRPDYFVLHKVRYDEHGDEGHLEPFRMNLVYTAPRLFNPYPAIGESLSIYHFDWKRTAPADALYLIDLRNKVVVDRLNEADLEDQEKHGYRFLPFVPGFFSSSRVVSATYPDGTPVTDAALGIAGTESFYISVSRKKPLLIVLRTLYIEGEIQASVNGLPVGNIPAPTGKGWSELTVSVPDKYILPGQNFVEMRGTYMSAYYWFIQSTDGN